MPSGEAHPNAKLTWERVREIRASGEPDSRLAERFGVSRTMVSLVRANVQWHDPDYVPRTSPHSPYRLRTVVWSTGPCEACRFVLPTRGADTSALRPLLDPGSGQPVSAWMIQPCEQHQAVDTGKPVG